MGTGCLKLVAEHTPFSFGGGGVVYPVVGGEGIAGHEPSVLQDSVALLASDITSRSGVTHLEFSVLHRLGLGGGGRPRGASEQIHKCTTGSCHEAM